MLEQRESCPDDQAVTVFTGTSCVSDTWVRSSEKSMRSIVYWVHVDGDEEEVYGEA